MKKQNTLLLLALIILCFVSRIPQLISPNLVLDGDECIEALMAKHLYQCKDVAFYFYGQLYGFSLFETFVIAIFYSVFHVTDIAVKLAMLTMWTGGIIFFYRALCHISTGNKWLPVLVILVFIFCPAWAVWSMKARGGYLSSFLLTSVVISLLFNKSKIAKNSTWLFIGATLVFIYQCQPLFLPGLIPLLGYALYKNFSFKKVAAALAGIAPVIVLFLIIRNNSKDYYTTSPFNFHWAAFKTVGTIPSFLYTHFNGYYYFSYVYKPSVFASVLSVATIGFIVVIIIAALVWLFRRKGSRSLFYCSMLSVVFTFLYIVFRTEDNYRYFLPIAGYMLLAFFLMADSIKARRALVNIPLIAYSAIGIFSMAGFYDYAYNYSPKPPILQTIKFAQEHHIQYAFTGCLLQWQLIFYADEAILCRWHSETDRYQEYVDKTDRAYSLSPASSALILSNGEFPDDIKPNVINLNNGYSILLHPDRKLLERMDFDLGKVK